MMSKQTNSGETDSIESYSQYYDLGTFHRTITTSNQEAQSWFNHGLVWSFGFNHEESVFCFEKALKADPNCVMAYWGLAYALGPNYNRPWKTFGKPELDTVVERVQDALQKANARILNATEVEKALVEAIAFRYPKPDGEKDSKESPIWNQEYANAMRKVYERFPTDPEVVTLYVDAAMNLNPWALWDLRTGEPKEGSQ